MSAHISMSEFRRFLGSGIGNLRGVLTYNPLAFKASELAYCLDKTAVESFEAIDQFVSNGWLTYLGQEDGLENWHLTRFGWYAYHQKTKDGRIKKAMVPILEKALEVLGQNMLRTPETGRVIVNAPWMNGLNLGAIVIGLECDSWPNIPGARRLNIIQEVLNTVTTSFAPAKIVVIGYSPIDGIPERLQHHKVLMCRDGNGLDSDYSIDVGEKNYDCQLQSDLIEYGMLHSEAAFHKAKDSWYWWGRDQINASRYLDYKIGGPLPDPVKPDPYARAKEMLAEEWYCTRFQSKSVSPTRKLNQNPPLESPNLRFAETELNRLGGWRSRDIFGPGGVSYFSCVSDELISKGLVSTAIKNNSMAKSLANYLIESQGFALAPDVMHVARSSRLKLLGKAAEEIAARPKTTTPHPVHYLAAFLVGLADAPIPFALIRQPGGHRAHIKEVYDLAQRLLVNGKYVHDHTGAFHAAEIAVRFRDATESEIENYDTISKAAGKKIKFITYLGGGRSKLFTGRFYEFIFKDGDAGIRSMSDNGQLPLTIDAGIIRDLITHTEHIAPTFLERLKPWWINPGDLPIADAFRRLARRSSDFDNRLGRSVDPNALWQIFEPIPGQFEARISCSPLMVTLLCSGDAKTPSVKLQVGEWSIERSLRVDPSPFRSSEFTGNFGEIHHFFQYLTSIAPLGLTQAFAEDQQSIVWMSDEICEPSSFDNNLQLMACGLVDRALTIDYFDSDQFPWSAVFVRATTGDPPKRNARGRQSRTTGG